MLLMKFLYDYVRKYTAERLFTLKSAHENDVNVNLEMHGPPVHVEFAKGVVGACGRPDQERDGSERCDRRT